MNRWLAVVVAVVATAGLAAAGCNNPICGPGTKQVQQKDGTLQCQPVDQQAQGIPCDLDAGATIQGGICVSAVSCGPNTTLMNGQCVSTGGGGGVPVCANPNPGNFCVAGALLNFVDNMTFSGSINVAVYDPITFLGGGAPLQQKDVTGGGYIFQNVPAPTLGLIVIVTTDAGGTPATYVKAAAADQGVSNGNIYRIDGYVLPKSVTDGWKQQLDISVGGPYVAKFYNDPKPANTLLIADEKNPVADVQLVDGTNMMPLAGAKYFDTSLTTISATATATSAVGAAIVAAPVTGSFPSFSGKGPTAMPITWETEQGGSLANGVLVARFHPNM
jgi:hypothetical protein